MLNQKANGLTAKSLEWYGSLLAIALSSFGDKDIEAITSHDLRHYVVALQDKYTSESTVSAYKRQLHKFWKWASDEYGIPNPMRGIRYPPMPKSKPKALDFEDFKRLFAATGRSVMGARDRAILLFLLDTGCRAGGLCGLRVGDVRITDRLAIVTEKGNKTRKVYFTESTAHYLNTWAQMREPSEWFFYSMREGSAPDALTVSGLYQVLRRLARKAKIHGKFNPHGIRHLFAKEYLLEGGDLATLSKIMGHARTSTTSDHYLIFTEQELGQKHEEFSPVKKLNLGKVRET